MLIFISWSGQRSKVVAEALENWVAQVIQSTEPWISQDIDKGSRWGPEIADRLERSKVGIICLTKSNLDARWIHFEAGALSKTKDAYVCTLLLDIKPSDVEQPLAQFQHTTTEKEDIFQLLSTINRVVQSSGEKALSEPNLSEIFEIYWPRLEEVLQKAKTQQESESSPVRSTGEILQEMLEILRNQERRRLAATNTSNWLESQLESDLSTSTKKRIVQFQILLLQSRAERLITLIPTEKLSQVRAAELHKEINNISSEHLKLFAKVNPSDATLLTALEKLHERVVELESMYLNALKTVYSEAEEEMD